MKFYIAIVAWLEEWRLRYAAFPLRAKIREALRLWQAWLATFVLLGVVYFIAPQQLGVIVFKCTAVGIGALGGFWSWTWTYGHLPADASENKQIFYVACRTLMMCAGMLAVALMQ